MKALKHIALLFIALITVSSCNDDIYEETWFVKDFEVKSSHWQLIGESDELYSYYEYIIKGVPLNNSYYDGVVTAYIYFDYDTPYEIQSPLPYIEYKYDTNNKGEDIYYSIQYSYDIKADGTIALKAYVSDFYTGHFYPGTQHFRVAIVY